MPKIGAQSSPQRADSTMFGKTSGSITRESGCLRDFRQEPGERRSAVFSFRRPIYMEPFGSRASFIIILSLLLFFVLPARAENKLAFVVGINAYPNLAPDAQLQRAVNVGEVVGDTLRSLGFTVTRLVDDQFVAEEGSRISALCRKKNTPRAPTQYCDKPSDP